MSSQDDLKKDAWEKLSEYLEELQSRIDLELESVYEDHFISDNADIDWDDPEKAALAEEELAHKNEGIYVKGAKIELAEDEGEEELGLNEKIGLYDLERINSALQTLRRFILNKSGGGIRSSFDELYNVLEEGLIKIDYKDYDGQNIWNDTFALVDILESRRVELLFENRAELIQIPKLLITVNNSLFKLIEREPTRIFDIPPRLFEEMIAEIFNKNGFYVELTKATRDGGRDIIAIGNKLDIETKYIIECKRYAPHNKVGLSVVQRLLGVKIADDANKAILATTSSFTSDAISFVKRRCMWDVALKDYNDIMAWINNYNRLVKMIRN
jgi:hypothetical protein